MTTEATPHVLKSNQSPTSVDLDQPSGAPPNHNGSIQHHHQQHQQQVAATQSNQGLVDHIQNYQHEQFYTTNAHHYSKNTGTISYDGSSSSGISPGTNGSPRLRSNENEVTVHGGAGAARTAGGNVQVQPLDQIEIMPLNSYGQTVHGQQYVAQDIYGQQLVYGQAQQQFAYVDAAQTNPIMADMLNQRQLLTDENNMERMVFMTDAQAEGQQIYQVVQPSTSTAYIETPNTIIDPNVAVIQSTNQVQIADIDPNAEASPVHHGYSPDVHVRPIKEEIADSPPSVISRRKSKTPASPTSASTHNANAYDDSDMVTTSTGSTRKRRRPYTKGQIEKLETEFAQREFINREVREEISQRLGLTDRQVKIWFQNRRMKKKRLNARGQNDPTDDLQSANSCYKPTNPSPTWESSPTGAVATAQYITIADSNQVALLATTSGVQEYPTTTTAGTAYQIASTDNSPPPTATTAVHIPVSSAAATTIAGGNFAYTVVDQNSLGQQQQQQQQVYAEAQQYTRRSGSPYQ